MNLIRLAVRRANNRSMALIGRQKSASFSAVHCGNGIIITSSQNNLTLPRHSIHSFEPKRYFSSDFESGNTYDDNNEDWQEWFGGVEYENAWLGFQHVNDAKLDQASRFLLQNLQDLYHGILHEYDRPTTERCNKVLSDIVQFTVNNNVHVEQYAFRADAILQCMQLFLNIVPQDSVNVRLPYPLPLPNRDTYVHVLTLYSKCKQLAAKRGPLRCLEIVEQMKQQSNQMGDLVLQPIAHDYNKVLVAWGTSQSPQKAYYAAELLLQLKKDGLCDDQSYTHVLRACAFSKLDDNAQAEILAARIAVKVYHDMLKRQIKCTPLTYSYYLRACAFLDNERQRDAEVEEAFRKCRSEGNVDDTILVRLKNVASPSLWKQLMG